jgi:membrane fusion protein, multidrug efflux system
MTDAATRSTETRREMSRDNVRPADGDGAGSHGSFEDDPGASRSRWVAAAVVVALAVWMGSGFVFPAQDDAPAEPERAAEIPAVAIRSSTAEIVQQFLRAEGQTEPERSTVIPAQAAGEVTEVGVRRGADVQAGDIIARIGSPEREAALDQAQAEVDRARREFENAQTLLDRGVGTVDRLAQTRSTLAAAEAQVAAAEDALGDLVVRAPFAGRVETLDLEVGEFVQAGARVARIVDLDPIRVLIRIPQQSVAQVEAGQRAEVTFITGQTREGEVIFVGAAADPETRTFEAEVEVPNGDRAIPAGISAQVRLPTGEARAHFVSPAVLSLDVSGTLGVKTVTEEGLVAFHAAEIVRAQTDGVWITGLPDTARIITVGQGFVSAGEEVLPRDETELEIGRVRSGPDLAGGAP